MAKALRTFMAGLKPVLTYPKPPLKPYNANTNPFRYSLPRNPNAFLLDRERLSFGENFYQYLSPISLVASALLALSVPFGLIYYNSIYSSQFNTLAFNDLVSYVKGLADRPSDNIIAIYHTKRPWNLNLLYKKLKALQGGNLFVTLVDCVDQKGIPSEIEKSLTLDGIAIHLYKFGDNEVSYTELDRKSSPTELARYVKQLLD